MKQTKTIKLHLITNELEREKLHNTMKLYSSVCNEISEYVFRTHLLNNYKVHKNIYYLLRIKYGIKSQPTISCIRTVVSTYKTILTLHNEWIKPKFNRPQFDLVFNRDYSFNKDRSVLSISTNEGRIKVPFYKNNFEQYFNNEYEFGTAKLVFKHGKFFLHIPVTYEIEEVNNSDITNIVGHDRGIRFLVTSYDSKGKTTFYNGKEIKQRRGHYKKLRQQLQKVGTPSSRQRLKAIGQRENRWMQDVNHCLSKALVENNPKGTLHVLEDLSGVRNATEKVRVKDRYVSVSWSYYDLEQKLIYKAKEAGQKVIKVDPRYTSQTCPKCGHIERANRNKSQHLFCCKNCGYKSNDDRIGAMNLYRMGIEYLVELQVSTSDL